jgi:hypothetical protein
MTLFPSFTKKYPQDKFEEFRDMLEGNELPESLSDIGNLISRSLKYSHFRIVNEEDDSQSFTVQIKPVGNSINTVDYEERTKLETEAYIHNNECIWHLTSEQYDESLLPELRQAFCEGESFRDREADYKYHFINGDTEIAVSSSNPVDRLDKELNFTAVEFMGGMFPRKWLLSTDNQDYYYLRERSGTIKLISDSGNGDLVYHAYIGREHPGTQLTDSEVLEHMTSVEYINIAEDPEDEVPEEAHEEHWGDYKDEISSEKI